MAWVVALVAATVTTGIVYGAVWVVAQKLGAFALIGSLLPILLFGPFLGAILAASIAPGSSRRRPGSERQGDGASDDLTR